MSKLSGISKLHYSHLERNDLGTDFLKRICENLRYACLRYGRFSVLVKLLNKGIVYCSRI